MRVPIWLTIVAALAALVVVLIVGRFLITPPLPLIVSAAFAPDAITPNADGSDDVTIFSYELARGARVTMTFEGEDGTRFVYRNDQARAAGPYSVQFSGVVDGYVREGEQIVGEVLGRLMPDGLYTWHLTAVADDGSETMEKTGTLSITDGDTTLPDITDFTIYPEVFTPNQDSIFDRTAINVFLSKDVQALTVYLQREGLEPIYVPERQEDVEPNAAGRHWYDYEGGVDLNADPPPDGEYTVVALAQDAVGQRIQRTGTLTIQEGGKPLGHIIAQPTGPSVVFEARPYEERFFTDREQRGDLIEPPSGPESLTVGDITMQVGDMLVFQVTVENYSDVPLRTHGSPPGTVFEWDQISASLGEYDESGAWRVGIQCDTAMGSYPWRWALAAPEDLEAREDPNNENTYYYLAPGERAVVWGAIHMTTIEARNPQNCWAGLIQEDVDVYDNNVGARQIELVDPSGRQTGEEGGE
jgi:hypothetical protein